MSFKLDNNGNLHRQVNPAKVPYSSMLEITKTQHDALMLVPPYHRNTTTGNEMTAGEKSTADTARLPRLKTDLKRLHAQTRDIFVEMKYPDLKEERYPLREQVFLFALLNDAQNSGLANRAAYIQRLVDWCKVCNQRLIDAETAIDAATRPSTAEGVTIDYDALESAAPNPPVTIRGAMAIAN